MTDEELYSTIELMRSEIAMLEEMQEHILYGLDPCSFPAGQKYTTLRIAHLNEQLKKLELENSKRSEFREWNERVNR